MTLPHLKIDNCIFFQEQRMKEKQEHITIKKIESTEANEWTI